MRKLASLAVVALFSTGCGSVTLFQAARPIRAQTLQFSLGTQLTGAFGGMTAPLPQTEVGLRYGVVPGVDVGARIFPLGFGADAKVLLLDTGDVAIAAAPGFAKNGFTITEANSNSELSVGVTDLHVPVPVEFSLSRSIGLIVAPRMMFRRFNASFSSELFDVDESEKSRFFSYAGATIGLAFHGTNVTVLPEFTQFRPVGERFADLKVGAFGLSVHIHAE